jgi:hypothetical protein
MKTCFDFLFNSREQFIIHDILNFRFKKDEAANCKYYHYYYFVQYSNKQQELECTMQYS